MTLLKENINNLITDDLDKRNQNWTTIEDSLELKADIAYVDSQVALKADKTYVDSKVQTDVPSGAKFTDTITTINGKTGAITKADITSLGIPAQDTVVDISGKADKTYVDNKVKTDVPAGAKFTDTVYTHPANHPASMITESSTKRFVSDSEKSTWNSKSDTDTVTTINGKTGAISKADITALGIPSQDTTYSIATTSANGLMSSTDKQNLDANTTSRHTHINKAVIDKFSEVDNKPYYDGAEIGGGSIVDLGTFNDETEIIAHVVMNQLPGGHYTFIMNGWPIFMLLDLTQFSYIGTFYDSYATFYYFQVSIYGELMDLKMIDLRDFDDGYMPRSGGVLENYREKLVTLSGTSTTIYLSLANVFTHTLSGNTTYSITNTVSGQAHSFTLIVNMGSAVRTLTFPASVKWQGGEIPDMTTASKTYILTFMTIDGGTNWLGIFGGEF